MAAEKPNHLNAPLNESAASFFGLARVEHSVGQEVTNELVRAQQAREQSLARVQARHHGELPPIPDTEVSAEPNADFLARVLDVEVHLPEDQADIQDVVAA